MVGRLGSKWQGQEAERSHVHPREGSSVSELERVKTSHSSPSQSSFSHKSLAPPTTPPAASQCSNACAYGETFLIQTTTPSVTWARTETRKHV